MGAIWVRRAEAADTAAIGQLINGIQRNEFAIPITLADQPDLADIEGFYRKGAGDFWVADSGGRIVGTVALIDIGEGDGALRKMFVDADFRGADKAVARRLRRAPPCRGDWRGRSVLHHSRFLTEQGVLQHRRTEMSYPTYFGMKAMLCVAFVAAVLSGCSASRILNADFDEYDANDVDADFAGSIPGIPEGDAIESGHFLNGSLSIEVNGPAGGGNNLRVLDVSPPGIFSPALVSFAVSDHDFTNEYRIVWDGSTEGLAHHTQVLFLDTTGKEAITLHFQQQSSGGGHEILFFTGGPFVEPIEVTPNSAHEVLVVIRPEENAVDVRYESSGIVRTRSNLPLKDAGFAKLGFVRFAGLNAASPYYLSHVNALARD